MRSLATSAVRRCVADYLAPARLDDRLAIESRVTKLGGATLELDQTVRRDGPPAVDLVRLVVRLVAITAGGRPTRIPAPLRALIGAAASAAPDPSEIRGLEHHGQNR